MMIWGSGYPEVDVIHARWMYGIILGATAHGVLLVKVLVTWC